jgi:hypothetical protein
MPISLLDIAAFRRHMLSPYSHNFEDEGNNP